MIELTKKIVNEHGCQGVLEVEILGISFAEISGNFHSIETDINNNDQLITTSARLVVGPGD